MPGSAVKFSTIFSCRKTTKIFHNTAAFFFVSGIIIKLSITRGTDQN